jgi:hypothetical protein
MDNIKEEDKKCDIKGVYCNQKRSNVKEYNYWIASYQNKNIKKKKSFSCNKYGYEKALEMAINKRLEWEEKYGKSYEDIE